MNKVLHAVAPICAAVWILGLKQQYWSRYKDFSRCSIQFNYWIGWVCLGSLQTNKQTIQFNVFSFLCAPVSSPAAMTEHARCGTPAQGRKSTRWTATEMLSMPFLSITLMGESSLDLYLFNAFEVYWFYVEIFPSLFSYNVMWVLEGSNILLTSYFG